MGLLGKLFSRASNFVEFDKKYYGIPVWGVYKNQREWRSPETLVLEPMDSINIIGLQSEILNLGDLPYVQEWMRLRSSLDLKLELQFTYNGQTFKIIRYTGLLGGKEITLYTYTYANILVGVWYKCFDYGNAFAAILQELNLPLERYSSEKALVFQGQEKELLWLQVMGNTQVMLMLDWPLMEELTRFLKESRNKNM